MLVKVILKYLRKNFLITTIVIYYIIAILLYSLAKIDILIPCMWHTIFRVHCPGCGLTRAFIELIQFNFLDAWDYNPLIFIVFPALSYYIINDFIRFLKKYKDIDPQKKYIIHSLHETKRKCISYFLSRL